MCTSNSFQGIIPAQRSDLRLRKKETALKRNPKRNVDCINDYSIQPDMKHVTSAQPKAPWESCRNFLAALENVIYSSIPTPTLLGWMRIMIVANSHCSSLDSRLGKDQ
jgi:hypothetical protein